MGLHALSLKTGLVRGDAENLRMVHPWPCVCEFSELLVRVYIIRNLKDRYF